MSVCYSNKYLIQTLLFVVKSEGKIVKEQCYLKSSVVLQRQKCKYFLHSKYFLESCQSNHITNFWATECLHFNRHEIYLDRNYSATVSTEWYWQCQNDIPSLSFFFFWFSPTEEWLLIPFKVGDIHIKVRSSTHWIMVVGDECGHSWDKGTSSRSYLGGCRTSIWPISSCFPWPVNRELDQNWNSQDISWCPNGMPDS